VVVLLLVVSRVIVCVGQGKKNLWYIWLIWSKY